MPLTPEQIQKIKRIANPLIRERYVKCFQLPQDIRQAIFNVESANKMNEISRKNNLKLEQAWRASYISGLILLGETNIVDFVKTLRDKCRLSDAQARQLARDINAAIFLPIKDSLKRIHRVSDWPREGESGPQNSPEENQRVVSLKGRETPASQPPVNANNIVNLREK